jgi:hypothetical protein
METTTGSDIRDQAMRWLADGGTNVKILFTVLDEFARMQGIALAAERDGERLRTHMETAEGEIRRLREGVARLRSDNGRCMKEREDIAAALSQFMGEVLTKLRGRPDWPAAAPVPPDPAKR